LTAYIFALPGARGGPDQAGMFNLR
jgi:hypothetical protein